MERSGKKWKEVKGVRILGGYVIKYWEGNGKSRGGGNRWMEV